MPSSNPFYDQSQDYGIDACQKCGKFIYYSSQQESQKGSTVSLQCNACKESFKQDVNRLLLQTGHPVAVQPVTTMEDIGPGDLICYLRIVTIRDHLHYAIVLDKDEYHAEVTVVEFVPHFPLRWGRVSECQRNIETDIFTKCGWVFRYMPCDCLPTLQVLENAKEFVKLNQSQWKHNFDRNNDAQHLASWCKSGYMRDLNKFIPSFLRRTFTTRLDLVRNCPAILHTNLLMNESCWTRLPLLDNCPVCEAHFNRSSLISANEILIILECGACSEKFAVRNMISQKQKLMSKYGNYQKENIVSLNSINIADILVFRRRLLYEHHSLITGKTENGVIVTEFLKETENFGRRVEISIRDRPHPLTLSELKDGKVKRFLPLDCLQRNEVLSKMDEFKIVNPPYRLDLFNCQTLCTFVKTGLMRRRMEYFSRLDLDPIMWALFNIFRRNRSRNIYLRN